VTIDSGLMCSELVAGASIDAEGEPDRTPLDPETRSNPGAVSLRDRTSHPFSAMRRGDIGPTLYM
jgi:hypothetical protein